MCAYPVRDSKNGIRKRVWMWVIIELRWFINLLHKPGEIWGRTEAARSVCFYFLPQNEHRATSRRFRVMQLKAYPQQFPVRQWNMDSFVESRQYERLIWRENPQKKHSSTQAKGLCRIRLEQIYNCMMRLHFQHFCAWRDCKIKMTGLRIQRSFNVSMFRRRKARRKAES